MAHAAADLAVGTSAEKDPRRWAVLGVLCFSLLLIVVDNTILNVALPTIQRELEATTSELQWIVDSYILVFAGLLLTFGALGDKLGRKGALMIGLVIMAGASALSTRATTPEHLIAARALLGVGAALIMPATLSILTNVFTDPVERGRAIAIWAGTSGMAVAIGPVSGGYLLEHFWWGSVFFVNIPVVAIALALGFFLIPTSRDPHAPKLDLVGAVLSIVGLTTLVWAIIEAPERGWTNIVTLAAFGVAAVVLWTFLAWERHVEHPMLDVAFFRNPRFSAASAAITLTFFAMFGSMFLFTQYMQFVLGYSALQAGLRLMPMAGVMMIVAPTSARLVERIGTKRIVGTGLFLDAVGLLLASFLTADSGYLNLLGVMAVMSTGMALAMAPATESIMGSLPPAKAGVGSAVNDTTRELGGALGVAVLGSLMASVYGGKVVDALRGLPLPAEAVEAARSNIGAAITIAGRLGPEGATIAETARASFVDGMGLGFVVAAAVALVGSVVAFVALPATALPAAHDVDDAPDEPAEATRAADHTTGAAAGEPVRA